MSILRVLLCIIFPPLAVLDKGCGSVLITLLMTLCGLGSRRYSGISHLQ